MVPRPKVVGITHQEFNLHCSVELVCKSCGKDLKDQPHDIIVQHRCEGILLYGICCSHKCWEKQGRRMAEGNR